MPQDQQTSQTFVMLAMGLVTGAVAVGLYQHGGLPGPVAAATALAVYVVLLTMHAVLWRARSGRVPSEQRNPAGPRFQNDSKASAAPEPMMARRAAAPAASSASAGHPLAPPVRASKEAIAVAQAASTRPALGPAPKLGAAPMADLPPLSLDPQAAGAQGNGPQGDESDYWSYRPASAPRLDLPPFVTGRPAGTAQPQSPADAAPAARRPDAQAAAQVPPPIPNHARGPREADVEVIQDAIKRLLQEVNAAEAQASEVWYNATSAAAPAEAQVGYSVDALKMAAEAMRVAGKKADSMPPPIPEMPQMPFGAAEQPAQASRQRTGLASASQMRAQVLSDAIKAGRIDVKLEPILGLEDHQTRHYEVSVSLRDTAGAPLSVDGAGPDLRGTGLLPLFDSIRITRTAAVARRLEERGKSGSIFSRFNGESVSDDNFLGELAETLHQRSSLAAQLVLSFSQADVRGFAAAEWDSLADMRALGFRFALSDITDLDMDFEALAEQGFVFAKLDANVFLRGLPAADGLIPSSDVCRHLAKVGLTLVVEHINDDDKLARIFGFGVLLGQGQLFGGPRPVRADVATSSTVAA